MAEGGKYVFEDYEDTEKSNETDGQTNVSPEDLKFLRAVKMLGISTKVSTVEDLAHLRETFKVKQEPDVRTEDPVAARPKQRRPEGQGPTETQDVRGSYHFPKLSTFYGEEGKGEIFWATWKFEVQSLISDRIFTDEQILQ